MREFRPDDGSFAVHFKDNSGGLTYTRKVTHQQLECGTDVVKLLQQDPDFFVKSEILILKS